MFKRPRLSAQNRLVNALPGLALLFIASACSGPSESPEIAPETTTRASGRRRPYPARRLEHWRAGRPDQKYRRSWRTGFNYRRCLR